MTATVASGVGAAYALRHEPTPATQRAVDGTTVAPRRTATTAAPDAVVTQDGSRAAQLAQRAERAAVTEQKARKRARAQARKAERAAAVAAQPVSFTLGSFNVLGSQHTVPRGDDHRGWPAASVRTPRQAAVILSRGADVVGLQEAQPDQLDGLVSATGYQAYPGYALGANETDNSILYNPARFELVSGDSFPIRFMTRDRPQTVVLLRDKQTGRQMYVVNCHTSAGHDGAHTASRHAGMATIVARVRALRASGYPVFVTGDMNDRQEFRNRVVGPAGLSAAIDGPWSTRRFGRGWMAVDWVASTAGPTWSGYSVDDFSRSRTSDHYFISARATIAGSSS